LFKCAIESRVRFGIYYGVSDNPDKPWSIQNATDELGFKPRVNSRDLLEDNEQKGKKA
jgi:NAD+ dependent glucose-6-phosphate dehydrogenase